MSYGEKTKRIKPLLNGTLTAQQIAERVGCDAKTVRGVATKLNLPIRHTPTVEYCAGFTRTNQARADQAAAARERSFLALHQAVSAGRPVRMDEISEQTNTPVKTLEKQLIKLRNEGRLQRLREGRATIWVLLEGGKELCRSITRDLAPSVSQQSRTRHLANFRQPIIAPMPDTEVERAKTVLRRRGDVVWTEGGVHLVNGRFRFDDAGLIARAEHAAKLDAQLRRAA